MRVLLLLLLPLVQAGVILTLSTKGFATEPPYEVDWVDPSTGQLTKVVDLGNYGPPTSNCLWQADNMLEYPIQNDTLGAYFAMVELSAGTIHVGRAYANTAFYDIQFDKVTSQTFAFVSSASIGVFEVLADQTLQGMTKLPGGVFGFGAYSSSKHIYFLRIGYSHVLAVSTVGSQKGAILYNVSTDFDAVGNLVYDDTFGVLYVWGYSNNRTTLASVDYTTGKTLKTFFTSPTRIAGPTCINKPATTIYTSLFDQAANRAMIHSVDLASGKASQVPTDRYAITMNCLSNSKQNFYEQKKASIRLETF